MTFMTQTEHEPFTPAITCLPRALAPLVAGLLLSALGTARAQFEFTTNNGSLTLAKYTGSSGVVVIPGTTNGLSVTCIGEAAFRTDFLKLNLRRVSIPDTVTTIGASAFADCFFLTNVTIPNALATIGDNAFSGCRVPSLILPETVTNIGRFAFSYCSSLSSITIPGTITAIHDYTFKMCFNLTNITIPSSVRRIGHSAFEECFRLRSVVVPDGVTEVASSAFRYCYELATVFLGRGVTNISAQSFHGCTNLSQISVDPLNSSYSSTNGVLFSKSQTLLVRYPARRGGVYSVPASTTEIGPVAFENCPVLTGVVIPPSVTNIGYYAFCDCTNLNAISVDPANSFYRSIDGVLFTRDLATLLHFPGGRAGAYTIPGGVRTIQSRAFEFSVNLQEVTIPEGVTSIGDDGFAQCSALKAIHIPDSVTNLGGSAFFNCSSLLNALIPGGAADTGPYTFMGCSSLTNVSVSEGVTAIGFRAFSGCSSLTDVSLPHSLSTIGYMAFEDCSSLSQVSIGFGLTTLEDGAFWYCSRLQRVHFFGNAPSAGAQVFQGASDAVVYYHPGKTGWGPSFAGRPAQLFTSTVCTSDNFDDNVKNTSLWGTDVKFGSSGQLLEVNGRLEFRGSNSLGRPFLGGQRSYARDWEFYADVSLGDVVLTQGNSHVQMFLAVMNPSDTNKMEGKISGDNFGIALDLYRPDNGAAERSIETYFRRDSQEIEPGADLGTTNQMVGLRISFDAENKTLTAWYDLDGSASGYSWLPLHSAQVGAGVGDWQMNTNSIFQVFVGGGVGSFNVTSAHDVHLDNFNLCEVSLPVVDTVNPVLSIVTPKPDARLTNSQVTVGGTARDNLQVAGVKFQLNDNPWETAAISNNGSNWTASVQLIPGTNRFAAYAVDSSGNASLTGTVRWVYVPTAPVCVLVHGKGTVTPNLNGRFLEIGKLYSMTAKPSAGFGLVNWTSHLGDVLTNKPTVKFLMLSNLSLFANFADNARPTLRITSPKANQSLSNAVVLATGLATDNTAVSEIWCQVNNNGWTQAVGTTNWTLLTGLSPGTNVFEAFAVDVAGNRSATNSVRFIYVLSAPLKVQVVGQGTVTPDYNAKLLRIGKSFAITAKPAKGSKFAGWTGSWATADATLKFTMTSNLSFTATFLDTNRPVNVVRFPAVNAKLTNEIITATGKATDNVGVTGVWYQLNANGWNQAFTTNHWTNWVTGPLTLLPGTNVIQAVAEDAANNLSLTNTVKFQRK